MYVCVMHGNGILDDKLIRAFGIVGITVNEVLDEITVLDPDNFIVMQGDFECLVFERVSLPFELISPDICFVQHRMIDDALAQEVAPSHVRVIKMEVERMVVREPVEGMEAQKLLQWNHFSNIRPHVEGWPSEIYVRAVNDSGDEIFQLFHRGSPFVLWRAVLRGRQHFSVFAFRKQYEMKHAGHPTPKKPKSEGVYLL
jgi:hypothetical protein